MVDSPQRAVPSTVRASFWLWIVSVVVSAIAVIVGIAGGQYAVVDVGGDEAVARAVAPIGAVIGLVIGGGLRVLFAIFMLRGRNWARIVLLILAILTAIGSISAIVSGSFLDVVAIVVTIIAAVLMYVSGSNGYFRRV